MELTKWLCEDKNPAVKYRTETEILGIESDKAPVIEYVQKLLPKDWQETKGLWYIYRLTSIAECGLTKDDIEINPARIEDSPNTFGNFCSDFMFLRTILMLGYNDIVNKILKNIVTLPDGGFLCEMKLKKRVDIPKSCVKANYFALLFCAEAKKRGIEVPFADGLLEYFWAHKIYYKQSNPDELILPAREGWRTIDIFHPFEPMRVGLHNIVEAFSALGYGNDSRLDESWKFLEERKDTDGRVILDTTVTKSYLRKEKAGAPSKWATFYAQLAEKQRG